MQEERMEKECGFAALLKEARLLDKCFLEVFKGGLI